MQLNVPPDLEVLIYKRLATGRYAAAEDVLRRALEDQETEDQMVSAHIEKGFLQAERGELIDDQRARREIQELTNGNRVSAPSPVQAFQ